LTYFILKKKEKNNQRALSAAEKQKQGVRCTNLRGSLALSLPADLKTTNDNEF